MDFQVSKYLDHVSVDPVQANASSLEIKELIQQAICSDQGLHLRPIGGKLYNVQPKTLWKFCIFRYSMKEGMKKLCNQSLNICETVLPDHWNLYKLSIMCQKPWTLYRKNKAWLSQVSMGPKILTCDSWVVNIVTNNVTNTDTSEYWHFRKVAERADLNRLTVTLTRIKIMTSTFVKTFIFLEINLKIFEYFIFVNSW